MNYENYPENDWTPVRQAKINIPEERKSSPFKRLLLRIASNKGGSKENLNVFRMFLYG